MFFILFNRRLSDTFKLGWILKRWISRAPIGYFDSPLDIFWISEWWRGMVLLRAVGGFFHNKARLVSLSRWGLGFRLNCVRSRIKLFWFYLAIPMRFFFLSDRRLLNSLIINLIVFNLDVNRVVIDDILGPGILFFSFKSPCASLILITTSIEIVFFGTRIYYVLLRRRLCCGAPNEGWKASSISIINLLLWLSKRWNTLIGSTLLWTIDERGWIVIIGILGGGWLTMVIKIFGWTRCEGWRNLLVISHIMMIFVTLSELSGAVTLRWFQISVLNLPSIRTTLAFQTRFKGLLSFFATAPCDAFLDFKIPCHLRLHMIVSLRWVTNKVLVIGPEDYFVDGFLDNEGFLEFKDIFFSIAPTLPHIVNCPIKVMLNLLF